MSWKTNIAHITATALGRKNHNLDIEWRQIVLNGEVVMVPNKPLLDTVTFGWLKDRLLPLMHGGVVKIENRYYRVGLPRARDIETIREAINPNVHFWVKSATPRTCRLGPQKGKYVQLAEDDIADVGFLPVLYEIITPKQKVKALFGVWKRALIMVVKKVTRRVGSFLKKVWDYCKGWRSTYVRGEHRREISKGVFTKVKSCVVRGHFFGEVVT